MLWTHIDFRAIFKGMRTAWTFTILLLAISCGNGEYYQCAGSDIVNKADSNIALNLVIAAMACVIVFLLYTMYKRRKKISDLQEETDQKIQSKIATELHMHLGVIRKEAANASKHVAKDSEAGKSLSAILAHEQHMLNLINTNSEDKDTTGRAGFQPANKKEEETGRLENNTTNDKLGRLETCPPSEFMEKLSEYICEGITEGKIDYDYLAAQLCVCRAQLNRKVKTITGLTTTEYILKVRIDMAKHILTTTNIPVSEVAYSCGMDNISYFNYLFKKVTGLTPSQFRATHTTPGTPGLGNCGHGCHLRHPDS